MKGNPHSIRIFLLDGVPDGVQTAEIIVSTIEAIALSQKNTLPFKLAKTSTRAST